MDRRRFAANGDGALSPGGYSMAACFLTELLTFFFLIIIGTSSKGAAAGFAGIPISVTNISVNSARSTAAARFAGAMTAGLIGRILYERSAIT